MFAGARGEARTFGSREERWEEHKLTRREVGRTQAHEKRGGKNTR
jgi:hypothetical protein